MDVWIARDGVEIGAYAQADLPNLARMGHLQPTDHYWYDGLEDWGLLGELLGEDAWRPPAEIAPPISPRHYLRLIAAACAVIALFGIVVRLSQPPATAPPIALPPQAVTGGPPIRDLSRTDPKFRERAIAALDELVGKLPRAATLPTNLFYYSMNVAVPEAPGALTATISGAEDMVDPITQKTAWHTPFVLTLDYRDGQWMYRDYRASTTDMRDGTVAEIDGSRTAAIQPTIVSILGIKTVPDRIEHE